MLSKILHYSIPIHGAKLSGLLWTQFSADQNLLLLQLYSLPSLTHMLTLPVLVLCPPTVDKPDRTRAVTELSANIHVPNGRENE